MARGSSRSSSSNWRQCPQPTVAVRGNEVPTFLLLNLKAGGVVHIRAKATQVYCPFSCPFTTMVPLILKFWDTWMPVPPTRPGPPAAAPMLGGMPGSAEPQLRRESLQLSGRFPLAVAPASFAESLCSRNFSVSFCISVIAAAKWALSFCGRYPPNGLAPPLTTPPMNRRK